jgi:hypothetical protein
MTEQGARSTSVNLLAVMERASDTSTYLQELAATALQRVLHAEAAILSLEQQGRAGVAAGSGSLAWAGNERHYDLDAGPCLTALRHNTVVEAQNMAGETRWGWYPHLAARAGVGSALCLPLSLGHPVCGALGLFAGRSEAFTGADLAAARAWIQDAHAALMIGQWMYRKDTEIGQLREGLLTNRVIGQATGLLMAQMGCTADAAFVLLKQQSIATNIKVRDLAAQVVSRHEQAPATSFKTS